MPSRRWLLAGGAILISWPLDEFWEVACWSATLRYRPRSRISLLQLDARGAGWTMPVLSTVGGMSIWALDRIAVAALACWSWQVGERHAPRNALPGCRLPPNARRHATNEQLCGFGRAPGTGRSRPPRHGPDLARPGSHRLRRRPPARLSAHGIDGIRADSTTIVAA